MLANFKIMSIVGREDRFGEVYTVEVFTPAATVKEFGETVSHPKTTFECFYHFGRKEWVGRILDMYQFLDDKMPCVQQFIEKREKEIARIKILVTGLESVKEYGLSEEEELELKAAKEKLDKLSDTQESPCTSCPSKAHCKKRDSVYRYVPKVRLWEGATIQDTYKLASSVAGVMAKIKDPTYPRSLPSDAFAGFRRCSDCVHCIFVKRSNDPDGIDAVTGTITVDPETTEIYSELGLSHPDRRNGRDMREALPTMKCELKIDHSSPEESGWIKWDDSCTDYVWKGWNSNFKSDLVNAFRDVKVHDSGNVSCGMAFAVSVYR